MGQQLINLGAAPNDGTGNPLRTGGQKINENFTELYGMVAINLAQNPDGRVSIRGQHFFGVNDDAYFKDRWILLSDGNGVVDVHGADEQSVLLLHCNGTDGSTTFPDSSYYSHIATAVGTAQVDTAQSKFGGASLLLDGSGDYLTIPDNAAFTLGTKDFTIEAWCRFNTVKTQQNLLGQQPNDSDWSFGIQLIGGAGDRIDVALSSTGGINYFSSANGSIDWQANQWYHVAIARQGANLRMFVDGALINTTNIGASFDVHDSAGALRIGSAERDGDARDFDGWIDDVRITVGKALYTAAFTAPTAEFPNFTIDYLLTGEIVLDVATINKKFGLFQILEGYLVKQFLEGKNASLSAQVRTNTGSAINNVRMALLAWTGSKDVVTSDVVSAWNAVGTNPTFATNWTAENTAANQAVTDTYATIKIENVPIDTAGVKNVGIFIWVDDTDSALGNKLFIKNIQLTVAATAGTFQEKPIWLNQLECQRYAQLRSVNTIADVDLRPAMRVPPTKSAIGAAIYLYDAEL